MTTSKQHPDVAAVVVTYNRLGLLQRLVTRLLALPAVDQRTLYQPETRKENSCYERKQQKIRCQDLGKSFDDFS